MALKLLKHLNLCDPDGYKETIPSIVKSYVFVSLHLCGLSVEMMALKDEMRA